MTSKPKKKTGRPSVYTVDLADRICEKIATTSFGLVYICKSIDKCPSHKVVREWILANRKQNPEDENEVGFRDKYVRAKEAQADFLVEEILDIADNGTNDWVDRENPNGGTGKALNAEHIARSRLRVDSRKWLASKLFPKKYSDRSQVDLANADNKPFETVQTIRFVGVDSDED